MNNRIENKIDLLLNHFGIPYFNDNSSTIGSESKSLGYRILKNGFVQFDEINKELESWSVSRDLNKRKVAKITRNNFAVLMPDHIYDDDIYKQIKANQDRIATSAGILSSKSSDIYIGEFYKMLPPYYNPSLKKYKWRRSHHHDDDYKLWRTTNKRLVKIIANVSTLTCGDYSDPLSSKFYSHFFDNIVLEVLKKMNKELKLLNDLNGNQSRTFPK